jgi:hypothetical protein
MIEYGQALPCPVSLVLRVDGTPTFPATMTAADFCHDTPCITAGRAAPTEPPALQISPDKNMHYHDTTAGFTVPREFEVFVVMCQLDPAAQPCIRFLFVGSSFCTQASFRQTLAGLPLPSASRYDR